MSGLILNLLFVGVGTILGAAVGWWIRGTGQETGGSQDTDPPSETETPSLSKVEGLMARLHQLTAAVAADVGQHNVQIQQINDELSSSDVDQDGVVAIVDKLITMNEHMSEQLQVAEGRLQAQADEIQSHVQEARTDALTNLFNRRGFDDELQEAVNNSQQTGRPLSVMMVDVDFFKKFNDTYGHQAGDEVLKTVARIIRTNLADKEIVCRYGGEEFAAIFPDSDIEAAKLCAERARDAVSREVVRFEGMDLAVTASAGLSELQAAESAAEFVKRADQALYASKNAGRNCSHWHDGWQSHPVDPGRVEMPAQQSEETESPDPAETPKPMDLIEGISTHAEFCRDVDRRIGEWRRGGATASVVLMRVDGYNAIAEEKGEDTARVIRRAASQFVKATIRDMDHIALYSEDTFALLLPTATIANSVRVAERMRRAVERCELDLSGDKVKFTISLGVTDLRKGDQRAGLLLRAEKALAEASLRDGNKVCADEKTEMETAQTGASEATQ